MTCPLCKDRGYQEFIDTHGADIFPCRCQEETMSEQTTHDEIDERVEHMARVIYAAYCALNEWADDWDEPDAVHEETKAKYRDIADYALDKIEWTSFLLVRKDTTDV